MKYLLIPIWITFVANQISAQQTGSLSLRELLKIAEANYPKLRSKQAQLNAATEAVEVSARSRVPSLDAAYQLNYGTYNNITGMNYPQLLIPISGPPSSTNTYSGVFGSAASLLFNWQPITFGQRKSQIGYAQAQLEFANADAKQEILSHKVKVIQAYLDLITAEELIKIYDENLKRTVSGLAIIKTLVSSGIRPGVDTALIKAEVSKATVELLNSKKNREYASINFSQLLAEGAIPHIKDTGFFAKLPHAPAATDSIVHPLFLLYKSSIAMAEARKKAIGKARAPVIGVWGTAFARGSGIDYNNEVKSTDGFGFQRFNYGLGFQLSVPLLQFARINPQLKQQDFLIRSETENLNEVILQIRKQNEQADATFAFALAVSGEGLKLYESADFSYKAMLSRYQSGLANLSDLLQAQYVLAKSAIDTRTSYAEVWKALLFKAAVSGDLEIFLNQVQ